jgi:hypothetical protein
LITFLIFGIVVLTGVTVDAGIKLSKETEGCLGCHEPLNPGIVQPWEQSRHADAGVGCYECHQANKSDPDVIDHNGFLVSVIVTPKDCARCHEEQVEQFSRSKHATAAKIGDSVDNFLASTVVGKEGFDLGCAQCHGSEVRMDKEGNFSLGSWPNTGIGRINPDGTRGTCNACHSRHAFSVAQARDPFTCGKCHQGPDHPQIEVFMFSKHGIAYQAFKNNLNIDKPKWVLGEDYTFAPTCVTCHMGESRQVERTHDVGSRLAWTLRPVVSVRQENWEEKRENMAAVCSECHQRRWVDDFFVQFDNFVKLYNEKFAKPAQEIMRFLRTENIIDPLPFNEPVEVDFWNLWHREGRKARHGASMNAPDWASSGMNRVAIIFYNNLIPHAEKAVGANGNARAKKKWQKLKAQILNRPEHKWQARVSLDKFQKVSGYSGKEMLLRTLVSGN